MFELTKKTDYGVELMIELARLSRQGPVSLRKIANSLGLSFKFLEQVAIPLREAGLIEAREGKGGGYRLAKPAREIKVLDIIRSTEGEVRIKDCRQCRRQEDCQPKGIWKNLEKVIEKELGKKSLADFF